MEPISLSASATRPEQASPIQSSANIRCLIIGLTTARELLIGSDLSVAVIEKAVPCSGATGAGQGYIWMAHKSPRTDLWDLGLRSQKLWEQLAGTLIEEHLGWKKTGSLLVGRTPEEFEVLKSRVKQQCEAGLRAEYLLAADLCLKEPELMILGLLFCLMIRNSML